MVEAAPDVDISGFTFSEWHSEEGDRVVIDASLATFDTTLTGSTDVDIILGGSGSDTITYDPIDESIDGGERSIRLDALRQIGGVAERRDVLRGGAGGGVGGAHRAIASHLGPAAGADMRRAPAMSRRGSAAPTTVLVRQRGHPRRSRVPGTSPS